MEGNRPVRCVSIRNVTSWLSLLSETVMNNRCRKFSSMAVIKVHFLVCERSLAQHFITQAELASPVIISPFGLDIDSGNFFLMRFFITFIDYELLIVTLRNVTVTKTVTYDLMDLFFIRPIVKTNIYENNIYWRVINCRKLYIYYCEAFRAF